MIGTVARRRVREGLRVVFRHAKYRQDFISELAVLLRDLSNLCFCSMDAVIAEFDRLYDA